MSAAGRLLLPFLAALSGCVSGPPAGGLQGGLEGRIWDVRAERFIAEGDLIASLRAAHYRLLGEVHDNPAHHWLRASLIARLAPTEVFLEQFDRGQDSALRESQRAGPDADALARAGGLDGSWKWPLHRPIVQAALDARLPLRAANLSAADARRIARAGALAPDDAPLAAVLAHSDWPPAREAALRADILEGHCGALPERVAPAMALAQRARDAAIALALSSSGESAVLIAGNGHVRRDLGAPVYLPRDAAVVSVGLLETRPGETDPRAYARGADGEPPYDYIWFTAPHPRPDPCEAFRNRWSR